MHRSLRHRVAGPPTAAGSSGRSGRRRSLPGARARAPGAGRRRSTCGPRSRPAAASWRSRYHSAILAPMKPLTIPSSFTTTFTLEYGVSEADLRRLYENAKRDQWNASRDIPWSAAPSDDGRVIADELIDIYGSPLWDRLPESERVTLNRRIAAWRLSVLMHGEQGALLACSQMVDIVEGADAKFFQATQVVDEARHNEVLSRYLTERL